MSAIDQRLLERGLEPDAALPWRDGCPPERTAVAAQTCEFASQRPTRRRPFRRDIEGLRAVAVTSVVLYHAGVHGISGGYVGVDVFFVISGFLITRQLVNELAENQRISLGGFYARRARRILPAATVATIATVVASAVVLNPLAAQRVQRDAVSAALFGANYHFAAQDADYFNADLPPSPLQHYWSLSVEEQFYFVWPLLLMLSSLVYLRARPTREPAIPTVIAVLGAIATMSLVASVWETRSSPTWAYYSIATRAWELAVGALLALAAPLTRRLARKLAIPLTWAGLGAIGLAVMSFTPSTPFPGTAALLPVLGAASVIAGGAARGRWGAETLLGVRPFQRVGSWSYSWYLWHWPVLTIGLAVLGHSPSAAQRFVMVAISLAIAVISFVAVERPIRRIQLIVRRPALGIACGAALVACTLAVVTGSGSLVAPLESAAAAAPPAVGAEHGLTASQLAADLARGVRTTKVPSNLDPPLETAASAKPIVVTNGCHLQHPGTRSKPCIYGDKTSRRSIVLFGDSHAATWFPALRLIANRHHWRLVDLTKAGCPPVEVDVVFKGLPYPECAAWRRNAQAQIAAMNPLLVIVQWARYVEVPEARPLAGVPSRDGNAWQDGVAAIFSFLRSAARHTLFVSDTPTISKPVPDCVADHLSTVRACTTRRSAATLLPRVKSQELRIAKLEHIPAVDPTSWFCTRSSCPVIVGNILVYRDRAHMVPAWSRFIAPLFDETILRVVHSRSRSARR